ncbi:hypothetical protein CIW47_09690 [Mycolicibacterium sp. P1-5]|nr:hypothetical protein CIW47_09690 [Mycolicibacterium sp. P1-5]
MERGEHSLLWTLDRRKRLLARPMCEALYSCRAGVFRVRLTSGREIEVTADQQLSTLDGWTPLSALTAGDRLAVARRVPDPINSHRMADAEVVLLAHMIGDGSCVKRQPIRYASIDEESLAAVSTAARHFGVTAIRDDYPAARVTTLRLPAPYRLTHGKRNPIAAWLDGLGLFGKRSYEKFVPAEVLALQTDQVGLFLRHLWATDGHVSWDARYKTGKLYYASSSRRLIDGVVLLLLRVGVLSRIKRVRKAGYRDGWQLFIYGVENQLRFLRHVGVHGTKDVAAEALINRLELVRRNTNVDTIPKSVWSEVRTAMAEKSMTQREFAAAMNTKFCGAAMWKPSPSRGRLHRAAAILEDRHLHDLATSDVFWDEIVEITSIGHRDVYDLAVDGADNVMVQGIFAHSG